MMIKQFCFGLKGLQNNNNNYHRFINNINNNKYTYNLPNFNKFQQLKFNLYEKQEFSSIVKRPGRPRKSGTEIPKESKKKEEFVPKVETKNNNLFQNLDSLDMSNFTKEEIEETIKLLKEDYENEMARIDKKYEDEDDEEDEGEELEEVELDFSECGDPNDPKAPKVISFTPLNKNKPNFIDNLKEKNKKRGVKSEADNIIDASELEYLDKQTIEYLDDTNRVDFSQATIDAVELLFEDNHFRELQSRVAKAEGINDLAEINGSFTPDQFVEMLKLQNAEDILVIDTRKKSNWLEYVILCTSYSDRHRRAIGEFLRLQIRKRSELLYRNVSPNLRAYLMENDEEVIVSKKEPSEWIVVDSDKVNIYIFEPDTRKEYDIEGLWMNEREELPSTEAEILSMVEKEELPHKDIQIIKKGADRKNKN